MTKENPTVSKMETLTEQWKNRTLKDNWYYILFANEKLIGIDGCTDSVFWHTDNKILKILAPVPTYKEFFEDKKIMKGLGRDYSELMNQKVELLEKIKQIEELFRYALFSDSDGHYKPCKNTTKQEAYNILGRIQEILGTNKHNSIYGREPDRVYSIGSS